VGKPVFHKVVNEKFGSWLRDPSPDSDREKTFVTNENDPYNLFEFTTRIQYRMNSIPRRKYEIQEGFHVSYEKLQDFPFLIYLISLLGQCTCGL